MPSIPDTTTDSLLLHPSSFSPRGSPDLSLGNNNSATFSSSSTTPDHIGAAEAAENHNNANTSYDDADVPSSPGLGGAGAGTGPSSSSAFTYTPNPDSEDNDKLGGPLHPGMMLPDDVEYGHHRHSSNNNNNKKRSALFDGRKKWYWAIGGALLAVIIVGATVGGIKGAKKSSSSSSSGNGITANDASGNNNNNNNGKTNSFQGPGSPGIETQFGTNGSTVTMENGQTFTYVNNFGGYYVNTPFDDSAKAQSYTPALNESWDYTNMKMFGVNLGGWLVTEPFIVPGLFEPYEHDNQPAVDEYTLMSKYGNNATARMQEHYDTFITEEDFALIAGAGLNWVRIPIGHWAIETVEGEPFVEGLSWQYLVKALNWARKYGLRVNLDLHTAPGSQNGWNHSGRLGSIGWLRGVMGLTNAQRALNHIRTLTEFISQPQYKNVVQMFSILNEPSSTAVGPTTLRQFNMHAYNMIRNITGTGEGNGPWIMIHDGFENFAPWRGFMSGADRLAMDQHNYLVFSQPNNDAPGYAATRPCNYWGGGFNASMRNFGMTVSGEWCLAINDCGQYLNNVGNGARFEGTYIAPGRSTPQFPAQGSCDSWNDYRTWSDERKAGLRQVAYAHMDALQNWFFWTWKIGVSTRTGIAPNPMWHMKLALQEGYFPLDPRQHVGKCAEIVADNSGNTYNTASAFTAFPSPWMTGGAGAGTIAPAQISSYGQWPPRNFQDAVGSRVTNLPSLVPTGTPITLSNATPTPTQAGVSPGGGWANPSDTAGWYAPKSGCNYLNPYSGVGAAVPTAAC